MLRKSLNFLALTAINSPSRLIIIRNYAPRWSRDPGIENRKEDFGKDFLENQNDPEFVVSYNLIH
jgi:hypothetical protein